MLLPGPPHPPNTCLVGHASTVVCVAMRQHTLLLEPRDQYHNMCFFKPGQEQSKDFTLQITDVSGLFSLLLPYCEIKGNIY